MSFLLEVGKLSSLCLRLSLPLSSPSSLCSLYLSLLHSLIHLRSTPPLHLLLPTLYRMYKLPLVSFCICSCPLLPPTISNVIQYRIGIEWSWSLWLQVSCKTKAISCCRSNCQGRGMERVGRDKRGIDERSKS